MDWKHGYFAESGYTYGFYPEVSPARLGWIAHLKGLQQPGSHFRYIDMGCGQGLGLLILASCYPQAEFVGIDFMPEHIAHARQLAKRAGLTNVTLIEGDFLALNADPSALKDLGGAGTFDYAVAHGITTWIAPEVREALFGLTAKLLGPGGLFYNSYNTYPGWLAATPFQHLVSQLQSGNTGKGALQEAIAITEQLQGAGSALFKLLPSLKDRMESMKKQDAAYLVQEYNNQYWEPVFCATMLKLAESHKMQFLASATLPEVFEGCMPPALQTIIKAQTDPTLAETVRDLAISQSFRRDIYVKGMAKVWQQEQLDAVSATRFIAKNDTALPEDGKDFTFSTSFGTITGKRDSYLRALNAFGDQGASMADAMKACPELNLPSMTQTISMLITGGWLALEQPGVNPQAAQKLNAALAESALSGAPYRYMALPRIADGVNVNDTELIMTALMLRGAKADQPDVLATQLDAALRKLGRAFLQDGKPINDPAASIEQAKTTAKKFLETRWPNFKRMGAI
ncbi:MAG: class I SAM-dependent methyltransferase [Burkholderiaceae bacterium]